MILRGGGVVVLSTLLMIERLLIALVVLLLLLLLLRLRLLHLLGNKVITRGLGASLSPDEDRA